MKSFNHLEQCQRWAGSAEMLTLSTAELCLLCEWGRSCSLSILTPFSWEEFLGSINLDTEALYGPKCTIKGNTLPQLQNCNDEAEEKVSKHSLQAHLTWTWETTALSLVKCPIPPAYIYPCEIWPQEKHLLVSGNLPHTRKRHCWVRENWSLRAPKFGQQSIAQY